MHFDEILGKPAFLKKSLALWGQISRLLVGRFNSECNLGSNYCFYLFLVTDVLTKDKNFIHLTPLIRSQTSEGVLNYPLPTNDYQDLRKS